MYVVLANSHTHQRIEDHPMYELRDTHYLDISPVIYQNIIRSIIAKHHAIAATRYAHYTVTSKNTIIINLLCT